MKNVMDGVPAEPADMMEPVFFFQRNSFLESWSDPPRVADFPMPPARRDGRFAGDDRRGPTGCTLATSPRDRHGSAAPAALATAGSTVCSGWRESPGPAFGAAAAPKKARSAGCFDEPTNHLDDEAVPVL